MTMIKFSDIEQRLQEAIRRRIDETGIHKEIGGFTLVSGFINQPIQPELSGSIVIGGPAIPLVAVIGKPSGRVYFFALKALLPDIEL